jgi:hypothetical protein
MNLKRASSIVGVLVASFLPTNCRRSSRANEELPPVNNERKVRILQASDQVRERWNDSGCALIYQQAAVGFRSQPLRDWLSQCEFLKAELGVWKSIEADEVTICEGTGGVLFLDGTAIFGKGRYGVEAAWMMKDNKPNLLYLSFSQNGNLIGEAPSRRPMLLDPPSSGRSRRG